MSAKSSAAKQRGLGPAEAITLVWFVIDALTHLTIELGYVWTALGPTAAKDPSLMGFIWREYGRADKRWAVRDANVISLELLTGPFNIARCSNA
jgi:hypothetical protein